MNGVWRNIILGLLLANVLLLAWKRWVVPPDAISSENFGQSNDPQLVLASSGNDTDEADIAVPQSASTQPEPQAPPRVAERARCARVGPFADSSAAELISQQLAGRGFSVTLASEQGDIWVGHWVQLLDLKTEQDARRAVDRLVDAGLVDTYIVQTEPTYNVSLGVFRGRKGADRVRNLARDMGMNPQMMDRFRAGTQHWIKVRFRDGEALNLQDIRLESRQILRTEEVPCTNVGAMDPSTDAKMDE
jgi:hypothetical protein